MNNTIKILTIIIFFVIYGCELKNENKEYADMLIEKVEKFKKENNRLPKNVSEFGLTELMDSPAFYQMENDSTYIVWLGLSVGESKVYSSSTKKWTTGG